MMLIWPIRYLDRNDKIFKDRRLFLDTESLDPVTRAAVELVTESNFRELERRIIKCRHLFQEMSSSMAPGNLSEYRGVGPTEYFEDETGIEITVYEMGPILTDDPEVRYLPSHTRRHDLDLMIGDRAPIPLAEVTLNNDEMRLLGYFTRDFAELRESAFMKEGPGKLTGIVTNPPQTSTTLTLKTAVSDEEIRSFVTIFRRLYMDTEPANFKKAAGVFAKALGDHPYGKWVTGEADEFETHLVGTPQIFPLVSGLPIDFETKRLIDVFLYTQYAHQPDQRRQRQFNDCLMQVHGSRDRLAWMFFTEIWKCGLIIGNAGRVIDGWFKRYCGYHRLAPDILTSLRDDLVGLGSEERKEDRRDRLLREKVEQLATMLWERAGRPEGGPDRFRALAREQLGIALRVGGSD
jgi:hypothetical protein